MTVEDSLANFYAVSGLQTGAEYGGACLGLFLITSIGVMIYHLIKGM